MKKRLSAIILCAAMSMAMLAGCSSGGDSANTDTTTNTETAAETSETSETSESGTTDNAVANDLSVAVFYYTYSDVYVSTVRAEMDAMFNSAGIAYQNYDSNSSQTTQNEQIDTAISIGANVLVVNLVDTGSTDAAQAIVDKASAANIPVIFFNRAVGTTDEEEAAILAYENSAFVGTDPAEAGHMQGELIGNYLIENYDEVDLNGDGVISYAMFMGQLGNYESIYRTQFGVEDADAVLVANGKPELDYFDASNPDKYQVDQNGNWSAQASNEYMVTNLSQYNESNGNMIELIICNNDDMAVGAISALNDKGYNLGYDDSGNITSTTIPVFGVDAVDAAKELINDGKMTGTVKQDGNGMAQAIIGMVTNYGNGESLMSNVAFGYVSDNFDNKVFIPYSTYTGEE